jgi:antitoxin (DNA-binding transcriptional repressor) of toxin-antitoxin stability system
MKIISRREFESDPDPVIAGAEAGETYLITSAGRAFAELRPPRSRRGTDGKEPDPENEGSAR